ncbi:josephin protein like [Trichuris trichiura]|uniref:ubiquitinyl hydrolase 1 n=1 Tax=Trichuris trichiura TaxID=36087 RepID=A0A077ZEN2_TRITR|nr:josephin protein like [Trichuris trichiura]
MFHRKVLSIRNLCLATVDSTKDHRVYHEKQLLQLCALHALNNLFQKAIYTKAQLDEICLRLTPSRLLNPHRSMFGLGDYDINVIQEALLKTGCSALWFDRRKNVDSVLTTDFIGFIVNVPSSWSLLGVPIPLWSNRHWVRACLSTFFQTKNSPPLFAFQYAIREIEGTYYNLDSKLSNAQVIGGRQQLVQFLSDLLQSRDVQLFTIVRRDSADNVNRRQSPDVTVA